MMVKKVARRRGGTKNLGANGTIGKAVDKDIGPSNKSGSEGSRFVALDDEASNAGKQVRNGPNKVGEAQSGGVG